MILTLSDTAPEYNGRLGGTILTSSGRRAVARSRSRPASKRQRQQWSPPFSLAAARATWSSISPGEQEAWEDYAAAEVTWPIEGSPRYATGEDSFANYYTVQLLIDPLAIIPDAPTEGVTWQPRPKFFPFAEWESSFYTLKAETDFAENTTILFSSVPPSATVFDGEWFGEKIVGSELFEFGLFADEEFDGIHDMIEAQFGSIDNTQKIWGRCWEVQTDTGNIRVLKDPCTIDPTTPVPTTGLGLLITNGYFEATEWTDIYALNDLYEVIGETTILEIPEFESDTGTITLEDGYTLDDIDSLEFDTSWLDGESNYQYEMFDGSNPFEFTVEPM